MGRNNVSDRLVNELASLPGFRGCSRKQLALVDRLTYRATVPAGKVVIRERSFGNEAFVIVSGSAAVTKQERLVTTLGPGDYFGELSAIESARRNATLTAMSELTLLVISPREFATLVAEIPCFRELLLRSMVNKLRAADETIETMRIVFQDSPVAEALSNAPVRTAS